MNTSYSSIHELGHNLGCHHHKQQNYQPGPGLYGYSAGWRWIGAGGTYYCTVMTYTEGIYFPDGHNAIRLPFFSNPNVYYGGYQIGDVTDGDNARTIRNIRTVISGYRNIPPVANNDEYSTTEDTTKTIVAPGLLINDNDDDDSLDCRSRFQIHLMEHCYNSIVMDLLCIFQPLIISAQIVLHIKCTMERFIQMLLLYISLSLL